MNNEHEKLQEQKSPEKNSDNAFVQVGADGKPMIPAAQPDDAAKQTATPKEGTVADR